MENLLQPLLIIFSLVLSAFFSGMEIAFVSANKLRLELTSKNSPWVGKMLSLHIENPSRFITTALVGNNITLVIFGILMARFLEPKISSILDISNQSTILFIQTIITTSVVLVFGEFIPKVMFRLKSVLLLRILIPVFQIFYYVLSPLVIVFMFLSKRILRHALNQTPTDQETFFGRNDLQYFIKEADHDQLVKEANIDPKLLENAMELKDVKTRECMVPRTEVCAINIDAPIQELRDMFIAEGFSRIIVYEEDLDNILGYVHHFAMLSNPKQIRSALIPLMLVPESMSASDLLDEFMKKQLSIAWVVDEFGGTSGIVTLEDVMEEIFGEIQDEHDDDEQLEKKISETEFLFSARLEIDYINDKYGLELPKEDFETLSGLVLHFAESIPKRGVKLDISGFRFTILEAKNNRIEKLKLNLLPPKEDAADTSL